MAYLRAMAIGALIDDASDIFLKNETSILDGDFESPLLKHGKYQAQVDDIINLCVEKVYQSDEVVEKELAGYRIISNLLDVITSTLLNSKAGKTNQYDRLLLRTIGLADNFENKSLYQVLMTASGFVAGLTDSAAVHLNEMLMGSRL